MTRAKGKLLAVVRCGDASLHTTWAGEGREYDIGISYFGDDVKKSFPEARFVHRGKGGKWDGLFGFFQEFPTVLEDYEYFWLPDDDIAADVMSINHLIDIGNEFGLEVFQPALDKRSYYSHLITLRHQSFKLRYTNFVEIMVPVVSKAVLIRTLPLMEGTRSGFGIDLLWPQMAADIAGDGDTRTAIVDEVSVQHTRPVGGSLHKMIEKVGGRNVLDEMSIAVSGIRTSRNSQIGGVPIPRIRVICGLDYRGHVRSGVRLAAQIVWDLLSGEPNEVQPVRRMAAIRHGLKAVFPSAM